MAGELNGLQAKVRAKHESAIIIHCCAHVLNLVLSQAYSARKEYKIFFSTINGVGTFLPNLLNKPMLYVILLKKDSPEQQQLGGITHHV